MKIYELEAEETGFKLFHHRDVKDLYPHFHSVYEFIFIEQGFLEVNIDGETKLLSSGDACFVDSFSVHSYTTHGNNMAYVILDGNNYFNSFFTQKKMNVFPSFFKFNNYVLLELLFQICDDFKEEEEGKRTVFIGAMQILVTYLMREVPMVKRRDNEQCTLICKILRYAQEHLREDLSLSAIAQQFGYCKEHLSRFLHKYIKENWNNYVNRIRVEEVKRLLKSDSGLTIMDCAIHCGFNSVNTFYRAYKKEYGSAPSSKAKKTIECRT